jgi:hypothetical protein
LAAKVEVTEQLTTRPRWKSATHRDLDEEQNKSSGVLIDVALANAPYLPAGKGPEDKADDTAAITAVLDAVVGHQVADTGSTRKYFPATQLQPPASKTQPNNSPH